MKLRRRRGLGGGRSEGERRRARTGRGTGPRREDGPASASALAALARAGELLRGRRGRWVQTGIVILLCFGVGYFLAVAWLFPAPENRSAGQLVRVPGVVGQGLEEASARASERGLAAVSAVEVSHPDAEMGAVVAQSPPAGGMALPGDTLRLAVSLGRRQARVPPLRGLSEAQATTVLKRLGFTVRPRAVRAAAPGVQGTEPDAGALATLPAEVELRVGEGVSVVAVPDLRGLHIDDVEGRLEEAGLQLGSVRYDPDAAQAPGRIVGQSPPAGYSLRGGGFVAVQVAGRPEGG